MAATMKQDVIFRVAYYWKYLKMNSLLLTGETRISFQSQLVSYLVGQNFSKVFICISFFSFFFSFFLINCQIKCAATVTTVRSQRKRSQTCRENLRSAGNSKKRKKRDWILLERLGLMWANEMRWLIFHHTTYLFIKISSFLHWDKIPYTLFKCIQFEEFDFDATSSSGSSRTNRFPCIPWKKNNMNVSI